MMARACGYARSIRITSGRTTSSARSHGSPLENGYCESFNSKLRDEFLNGEFDRTCRFDNTANIITYIRGYFNLSR